MTKHKQLADMAAGHTIHVRPTKEDCEHAFADKVTQCMYAHALYRMFPTARRASVDVHGVTVTAEGRYYHFAIQRKAVGKIREWDNTKVLPDRPNIILTLVNSAPVKKASPERKAQVNAARNARKAAGKPDKNYPKVPFRRLIKTGSAAYFKAAVKPRLAAAK